MNEFRGKGIFPQAGIIDILNVYVVNLYGPM
jgi:hypothetical protein